MANKYNFSVKVGVALNKYLRVPIADLDLTGSTARMQVRERFDSAIVLLDMSLVPVGGAATIAHPVAIERDAGLTPVYNGVRVRLGALESVAHGSTAARLLPGKYDYDIKIDPPDGETWQYCEGEFVVSWSATRP